MFSSLVMGLALVALSLYFHFKTPDDPDGEKLFYDSLILIQFACGWNFFETTVLLPFIFNLKYVLIVAVCVNCFDVGLTQYINWYRVAKNLKF